MSRLTIVLLAVGVCVSSGCVASRKFVRHEVKTSADGLNARADGLSSRIDENGGEIRETQDAVHLVRNRVTEVDRKVGEVDTRVGEVDGRVGAVDGRVTQVDDKVAAVDDRVDAVNQEVRTVDTRVAVVDTRVDTVNTRVADLDKKTVQEINRVDAGVGAVGGKVDQTARNLIQLDDRFSVRNVFEIAGVHTVKFQFDSASLDSQQVSAIRSVAGILAGNRDAIVVLEGHTDSTGDRDYNIALGERRARAVRSYLAVDMDVPVYRIHEISLGTSKPVAPNDTLDGRQQNRSVTMTVLVPAVRGGGETASVGP